MSKVSRFISDKTKLGMNKNMPSSILNVMNHLHFMAQKY